MTEHYYRMEIVPDRSILYKRVYIFYSLRRRQSNILVPTGRAPFGQHQESRPLARSNDNPFLNGFVSTIDCDHNQSDLSDLTLNMHRVTGSP